MRFIKKIALIALILIIAIPGFSLDIKNYYFPRSIYYKGYQKLPRVLDDHDIKLYYQIYVHDKQGKFKTANQLMTKLHNNLLLPYSLYLRYYSTPYKASYFELKDWLYKYNSTAVASFVLKMLDSRYPNKSQLSSNIAVNTFYDRFVPVYLRHSFFSNITPDVDLQSSDINKSNVRISNSDTLKLDRYLKKGKTLNAKNMLLDKRVKDGLQSYTYAYYASVLAKSYFLDGEDDLAIEWGKIAIDNHKIDLPEAVFTLGLSYYRIGDFDSSLNYFKYLGYNNFSTDTVSKSLYWYAKSSLEAGYVNDYYRALQDASKYVYNFYGILAMEELGLKAKYESAPIGVNRSALNVLLKYKEGKRALALLQFGLVDWAEEELIYLVTDKNLSMLRSADDEQKILEALLYLVQNVTMPALSLKLSGENGKYYGLSNLSYPIFIVNLKDGYDVDPALVLAVIRRESLFYTGAESGPGARGLMQVMPTTADQIVQRYNLDYKGTEYYSPKVSIDLGQKYVRTLINNPNSGGNLIYVIAAYNGGFTNVAKWQQDSWRKPEDPVFFIESIPFYETRNYVKGVMTDYWIYQSKLGLDSYNLNLMAQSDQPYYYDVNQDKIDAIIKSHIEY